MHDEQKPDSMARFVMRLFGALFLLGGSVDAAVAAEAQNCHLVSIVSLDMRTLDNGLVTIPVKVQDRDLYFMVDTGGEVGTISSRVVTSLQLQPVPAPVPLSMANNEILGSIVTAQGFSIGMLKAPSFRFYVRSRMPLEEDGSLGPLLLQNYDVDFDFAGGKFQLMSPDHCPGADVYWTKGPVAVVPMTVTTLGHIRIPVSIDGKEIMATVDTGTSTSTLGMWATDHFLDLNEKSPGMTPQTTILNGVSRQDYVFPFKTISFEGITVNNPHIVIFPDRYTRGGGAMGRDLILGMDVLRQLHLYIAYKENKLYLTSATAH